MFYSTCCNAETNETEIGLCPECLEHCDFVDYEEEEEKEDNNWLWQAMARRDKAIKEGRIIVPQKQTT